MERIPAPGFSRTDQPTNQAKRVHVPGREEIGLLVDGGKNFGMNPSIYCVGIYFPSTGECVYYEKSRVKYVD